MNTPSTDKVYSPFWPLALLAISLIVVFGWNAYQASDQRSTLTRMLYQQEVLVVQGRQAEEKFKAMLDELVTLSRTDPEAAAIVKKYNIQINQPQAARQPGQVPGGLLPETAR